MKKILIIVGLVLTVILIVFGIIYFLNYQSNENGDSCMKYDDQKEECLKHKECRWDDKGNNCDSIDSEDDNVDNDEDGLNQELEAIKVPDNKSNELCKKLPLSGKPPHSERYQCLAMVNHDARFCEGMDEEKEKNMCLAYAKKDSSYCEKVENEDSKHVCYYQLAVSSNNADFCADITYSQHEKEQCYYSFMSNLYQWGKSDEIKDEYCQALDSPDENTCLALKAKDVSMCGNNPNCLTHFKQDISFCDKQEDYVSCIKDRAKTSKDFSICKLLSQPDRDSCVGVYCTHTELDVKICDKVDDIDERQDRYLELAVFLSNQ